MITSSCNNSGGKSADNNATDSLEKGSFSYDLNFLKQHDASVVVLSNDSGKAQVIVSPQYQAKVFTSTAD